MCKTSKEYCLAISLAKVMPCLGEWGFLPLLPHEMPQNLPETWESNFKGKYIEPEKLESEVGFTASNSECEGCCGNGYIEDGIIDCTGCHIWNQESDCNEVISLQIPGLVYIKDLGFMYNGKSIKFKDEDSEIIYWDKKRYVIKEH